jgi:hypothetical protein
LDWHAFRLRQTRARRGTRRGSDVINWLGPPARAQRQDLVFGQSGSRDLAHLNLQLCQGWRVTRPQSVKCRSEESVNLAPYPVLISLVGAKARQLATGGSTDYPINLISGNDSARTL